MPGVSTLAHKLVYSTQVFQTKSDYKPNRHLSTRQLQVFTVHVGFCQQTKYYELALAKGFLKRLKKKKTGWWNIWYVCFFGGLQSVFLVSASLIYFSFWIQTLSLLICVCFNLNPSLEERKNMGLIEFYCFIMVITLVPTRKQLHTHWLQTRSAFFRKDVIWQPLRNAVFFYLQLCVLFHSTVFK